MAYFSRSKASAHCFFDEYTIFFPTLLLEVTTALLFLMLNSQRLAKNLLQMQGDLEKTGCLRYVDRRCTIAANWKKSAQQPHARTGPQSPQRLAVDRPNHLKQMNDTSVISLATP